MLLCCYVMYMFLGQRICAPSLAAQSVGAGPFGTSRWRGQLPKPHESALCPKAFAARLAFKGYALTAPQASTPWLSPGFLLREVKANTDKEFTHFHQ